MSALFLYAFEEQVIITLEINQIKEISSFFARKQKSNRWDFARNLNDVL